jgi:hypothetical protein
LRYLSVSLQVTTIGLRFSLYFRRICCAVSADAASWHPGAVLWSPARFRAAAARLRAASRLCIWHTTTLRCW